MIPLISISCILPLELTASEKVLRQSERIAQVDPHGWTLTLVSIALVFLVLFLLCLAYTISGRYFQRRRITRQQIREFVKGNMVSKEEVAAATLALHLYLEEKKEHDKESGVITIKRNK